MSFVKDELGSIVKISKGALESLMHMTGCDYLYKEPGFRNYANHSLRNVAMNELMEAGLVDTPQPAKGTSAGWMWFATDQGMILAKAIYWASFGEQKFDSTTADLNKANKRLHDNGLNPVAEGYPDDDEDEEEE